MSRSDYYQQMRSLALTKRAEHRVETNSLNLTAVQRIYRAEGIKIDRWDLKGRKIKAAYFCADGDCSVLLNKNLPREPKLFCLIHELKHHYVDRPTLEDGKIRCGDYNANELIEISAEVFAAEFIYPEAEMKRFATELGIGPGSCSPEAIVSFKRQCPATISYAFIVKRFEWFGFIEKGAYVKIKFQKLEESIYGKPFYTQAWFKNRRQRRSAIVRPNA
jgi:Zn-dependent peptidase ImmA (M78 family)